MIFEPMVRSAQTVHRSCVKISTSPNGPKQASNELRHLGIPSVASKTISEPLVCLAKPCAYLTSTLTPSPNGPNEIPHDPRHLGFNRVRPKRFPSLWYVWRKPSTYLASRLALYPKGPNELPLEPRHQVLPSSATKTIYEPMVRLVQTMHLSCTDANTTSEWKEERFHMTHVTKEFHWVHPKWFRSL